MVKKYLSLPKEKAKELEQMMSYALKMGLESKSHRFVISLTADNKLQIMQTLAVVKYKHIGTYTTELARINFTQYSDLAIGVNKLLFMFSEYNQCHYQKYMQEIHNTPHDFVQYIQKHPEFNAFIKYASVILVEEIYLHSVYT